MYLNIFEKGGGAFIYMIRDVY